jgi:hypothetical protein
MSNDTKRRILEHWSGFDPYIQRVLINRFVETFGKEASRDDWLEFLQSELQVDRSG